MQTSIATTPATPGRHDSRRSGVGASTGGWEPLEVRAVESQEAVRVVARRLAEAAERTRDRMNRFGNLDLASQDVAIEVLRGWKSNCRWRACSSASRWLADLDVQKRVIDRTDMPIVFITGYGDVPMTVQAMKAGAVEFLTKPFSADVLVDAIRNAIERSRTTLGHEAEMRALRQRYASLTPREQQVMALVVAGLLNKQVGSDLGISEITVKAHRGSVMRKMEADSLADLVTMAARLRPPPASPR